MSGGAGAGVVGRVWDDRAEWLFARLANPGHPSREALSAYVRELLPYVAALREDARRLDEIEERLHGTGRTLSLGGSCYWVLSVGRKRLGEGDDLRDAIDDALDAEWPA